MFRLKETPPSLRAGILHPFPKRWDRGKKIDSKRDLGCKDERKPAGSNPAMLKLVIDECCCTKIHLMQNRGVADLRKTGCVFISSLARRERAGKVKVKTQVQLVASQEGCVIGQKC